MVRGNRRSSGGGPGLTGCIGVVVVLAIVGLLGFLFLPKSWFGGSSTESSASKKRTKKKTAKVESTGTKPDEAAKDSTTTAKADTAVATAKVGDEAGDEPEASKPFNVKNVINGNIVAGRVGDRLETVRLLYVDVPPAGYPGYERAKSALESLLKGGDVTVQFEGGEMRTGKSRLLAYLNASGKNVNVELVRLGHALHWQPVGGSRFSSELESAQTDAKAAGRGIWGYLKVMTPDMKRHVALKVASDGSSKVTLTDGRSVTMRNSISIPLASLKRAEIDELLGLGEGTKILKEMGGE